MVRRVIAAVTAPAARREADVLLVDTAGRLHNKANLMEELLEYGKPFRGDLYPAPVDEVIAKSLRSCLPAAEVAKGAVDAAVAQSIGSVTAAIAGARASRSSQTCCSSR